MSLGFISLNVDKLVRLLLFIFTLLYVSWTFRYKLAYYYAVFTISILFIVDVFFYGLQNSFHVSYLNVMLYSSSVNTLSAISIFLGVLHSFSSFNVGKKPNSILLCVLFLMTIPMYGRLGIILSLLIFFLPFIVDNRGNVSFKRVMVVPFLSLLFVFSFHEQIFVIYENSKFALKSIDSPRWDMWTTYLSAIDLKGLFFGIGYDCCSIIRYYDDNPHNSFINLHHNYGLLPVLCIMIGASVSISKANTYFILLFLIVLIRVSFDKLALFSYFDIFIVYSFWCCYYSNNVKWCKGKHSEDNYI
nr:hypothetical protein BCU39_21880 [Vibrio cyclitrophicus]